jgi:hypothetical protein
VARYRLGQYKKTVETLLQSNKLHPSRLRGPSPANLAFLAMAHHQLGQKDQAQEVLGRLRETIKWSWWAKWATDAEGQAFLREAEALIHGATANPK